MDLTLEEVNTYCPPPATREGKSQRPSEEKCGQVSVLLGREEGRSRKGCVGDTQHNQPLSLSHMHTPWMQSEEGLPLVPSPTQGNT